MNQKTSKVEKEFYLRCSYLTLSVLFDKEPDSGVFFLHKKQVSFLLFCYIRFYSQAFWLTMNVNSHSQTFLSSTYAADNAVPTDPFILVISK